MSNTLDIHDASKLMKVHPDTVLDMIGRGDIPAGKVGRAYVLLTSDVMNYIERIIVEQTADRMGIPLGLPKSRRQIRTPKIRVATKHG